MKKYPNNRTTRQGFVLLYAIVISTIVLSISLGVSNISFRELTFSTSARATNLAFFAADTGIECALYFDNNGVNYNGSIIHVFSQTQEMHLNCGGGRVRMAYANAGGDDRQYTLSFSGLGESGQACAVATVLKRTAAVPATTIRSYGYNMGGDPAVTGCVLSPSNPSLVERVLEVYY